MNTLIPKISFQRALGVILVLLSLATIVLVAAQTTRLSNTTECQAEYNSAYTKALQDRSEAARQERAAQRTLLVTLLSGPIPPEQARKAFDAYLASLDASDRERDSAPIPNLRC